MNNHSGPTNITIETMKNPNPLLSAYMNYVSDEGIDLRRFVEHGGRLLGREDSTILAGELADLREKISDLRDEHPRLGRQLEFLVNFFESESAQQPEHVRKEVGFALLYAAKDMDMLPDHMPGVGYLDDEAVVGVVHSRHAEIFAWHCATHDVDWSTLEPETAG